MTLQGVFAACCSKPYMPMYAVNVDELCLGRYCSDPGAGIFACTLSLVNGFPVSLREVSEHSVVSMH